MSIKTDNTVSNYEEDMEKEIGGEDEVWMMPSREINE